MPFIGFDFAEHEMGLLGTAIALTLPFESGISIEKPCRLALMFLIFMRLPPGRHR